MSKEMLTRRVLALIQNPFTFITIYSFRTLENNTAWQHQRRMEFVRVAELSGNGEEMQMMSAAGVLCRVAARQKR
jgi:hypothetical protein